MQTVNAPSNSDSIAPKAPLRADLRKSGFFGLLDHGIFAFSGCWAMMALWKGLQAMCEKSNLYPRQAIKILKVWILVFGFVGTPMAWSLRPFVGSPDLGYQLFRRDQTGNFYQAVWTSVVGYARGTLSVDGKAKRTAPKAESTGTVTNSP